MKGQKGNKSGGIVLMSISGLALLLLVFNLESETKQPARVSNLQLAAMATPEPTLTPTVETEYFAPMITVEPEPTLTPQPTTTPVPEPTSTPIPEPTATPVPVPFGTQIWPPPSCCPYAPMLRPTITLKVFREYLMEKGSPMVVEADSMYRVLFDTGTDPAMILGFLEHESTYGKAATYYNAIGMMCHLAQFGCWGNRPWQRYPNWTEAAHDWSSLMRYYRDHYNALNIEPIMYIYAPSFENHTGNYIWQIKNIADKVRNRTQF